MLVLSRIHDAATRNPPDVAYFDPQVTWPAVGGDYPVDSTVVSSPHLRYLDPLDIGGMNPGGLELSIVDPPRQSDTQIIDTIIHEAARRRPDLAGSTVGRSRRQPVQRLPVRVPCVLARDGRGHTWRSLRPVVGSRGQHPSGQLHRSGGGGTTTAATAFGNARQEAIFWHLVGTGYDYVPQDYVQVAAFKTMVDAFTSPVGGNLVNSVRIQTLSDRVAACTPAMVWADSAVQAVFAAADALDDLDRQFLQHDDMSKPFWDQVAGALSSELADSLHNTIWFRTREAWGDFPFPIMDEGGTRSV